MSRNRSASLFLALIACAFAGFGCVETPPPPAFRFAVAEVWPMQLSEDIIAEDVSLAVGEITEGSVRVGDQAIVRVGERELIVTVEKIRAGEDGEIDPRQASKGETVALDLRGVSPEEEWSSDELMGKAAADD